MSSRLPHIKWRSVDRVPGDTLDGRQVIRRGYAAEQSDEYALLEDGAICRYSKSCLVWVQVAAYEPHNPTFYALGCVQATLDDVR